MIISEEGGSDESGVSDDDDDVLEQYRRRADGNADRSRAGDRKNGRGWNSACCLRSEVRYMALLIKTTKLGSEHDRGVW